MSLFESESNSSQSATTEKSTGSLFAAVSGICLQLVSGVAVFQPFMRIQEAIHAEGWACLMSAALLTGCGIGYLLQFQFLRRWGRVGAIRFSVSCLAGSLVAGMLSSGRWGLLAASAPAGLGLFGEWTAAAGMTRRSFTSTQLWRGMRIHSVAWFVGGLGAALAIHLLAERTGPAIWLNVLCIAACVAVAVTVSQQVSHEGSECALGKTDSSGDECDAQSHEAQFVNRTGDTGQPVESSDECAADECCGGGCEWRPTPLWLGVGLAVIGMLVAGSLLPGLLAGTGGASSSAFFVATLCGLVVFQSVVPSTGYAVLLLSCCLLGLTGSGLAAVWNLQWTGVLATVPAALLAATYRGCSGLIGESFADAKFQNGRSFVLMSGALGAGAITAVIAAAGPSAVTTALDWGPPAVWLATILLVRNIPHPVLSQRREDEMSQMEADQILAETIDIQEDTVA